jgi:hypothetical protein
MPGRGRLSRRVDQQAREIERQQAEIDTLRQRVEILLNFAGKINAERDRSISLSRPALGLAPQYDPRPLRVPRSYLRTRLPHPSPGISIVTPSFNQGVFIERTICSILDQRYPSLEYVVQDGGSDDGTREVLDRYAARLTRAVTGRDDGQADAINRGFEGSTGEIMAYVNSDDILLPGSLAYVSWFLARHPEVDAVYGHRVVIDAEDRDIGMWVLPPHRDWVVRVQDFIPQETLFWRRRAWERVGGGFNTDLCYAIDWELLLRFVQAGVRMVRLPRFLGGFRVHDESKTFAATKIALDEEAAKLRIRWGDGELSTDQMEQRLRPFFRHQKALHLRQLAYDRVPIARIDVRHPAV